MGARATQCDLVHMKSNHLVASFLYTHADVLIKIVFDAEPRPDIPQIYIRIKRTDIVYVLIVLS